MNGLLSLLVQKLFPKYSFGLLIQVEEMLFWDRG